MRQRPLLRCLALAGILLAGFAHLIWNGWHARRIVAENLPHPSLSSGQREIDLWAPTYEPGRLYDLTFVRSDDGPETFPTGTRLMVQLASGGRTRLLVVRPGHPNTDVSWWSLLTGRERLQIVPDRGWVDLGPAPERGDSLEVQVTGLLPGPYGFAQLLEGKQPHFERILAVRPESPRARPTRTTLRYRFERIDPVPAQETLARFFFFVSCSRVLQAAGVVALALLFAGWYWLWEERATRAAACLVPAVTLLHACCLPPFQGADEALHEATVEALLWNPSMLKGPPAFPRSLSRVYAAIGYDRFAGDPATPVDITSPERRAALAGLLRMTLGEDATVPVPPTADERALNPSRRAVFYYHAFGLAGPLLRSMSVLDRLEAYVVFSALASLALFGAGLLLLSGSGSTPALSLTYGLVALLPYSVGVVASCSNYSVAIGFGQFLGACLLAGVLTDSRPRQLVAAALFTLASVVGIGFWDDFVFFAVPSTLVLTFLGARASWTLPRARRFVSTAALALGLLLAGAFAWALVTGRIRGAIASFGRRLPRELGGFEDPSLWLLLGTAAAPFVGALALTLAIVRSRNLSEPARRRAAFLRTAALAAIFAGMFLATAWRAVPFEHLRLDFPDEVAAHWTAFWSNSFAFDQDVLSWKMYWGVFGYADVSYPDALYALARWACVGLLVALPVLSWRFTQKDPARSAVLLVAAGYALSACVVTNSLRFFVPTNPWGRFVLPAFPLVALPLLARAAGPERTPALRLALALLVALHVWTAIALLGSRYAVGL